MWSKLNDQVVAFFRQGQYSEAAEIAKEALRVAEETYGTNHRNVATSLNNLAEVYRVQGRYAEAFDSFYKATWSQDFQAAAFYALAELSCLKGDYSGALELVED